MTAAAFVAELRAAGVELRSGDRLRYRAPAGADPALIDRLRRNAEAVRLALLRQMADEVERWPFDWRRWWWQTVTFGECGRLSRDEAAWRAYADVRAQLAEHVAPATEVPS